MPVKIFIGYEDRYNGFAELLCEGLKRLLALRDDEVFLAKRSLSHSQAWLPDICQALTECDIFIPLLSEGVATRFYPKFEIAYILGRRRNAKIYPLLLTDLTRLKGMDNNALINALYNPRGPQFQEFNEDAFIDTIKHIAKKDLKRRTPKDEELRELFNKLRENELAHQRRDFYVKGLATVDNDKIPLNYPVVGSNVTLLLPNAAKGWKPEELSLRLKGEFSMPSDLVDKYNQYKKERKDFFARDGDKIMLARLPPALLDATEGVPGGVALRVKKCKFSNSLFFQDILFQKMPRVKEEALTGIFTGGKITFPHNLCLHLIVFTDDNKVMLAQRMPHLKYYPRTWSCSLEENFDANNDLKSPTPIINWVRRTMREELYMAETGSKYWSIDEFRFLSVFLEYDCMNISLVGLARVSLPSEELRRYLTSPTEVKPETKVDYEYDQLLFYDPEKLAEELKASGGSLPYHPTSKYRMYFLLRSQGLLDLLDS